MRRGALQAGGSQEVRRGAGSERLRPWSSAVTMSAQCCAGQVSGAGLRVGVDRSGNEARSTGTARASLGVPPSLRGQK